MEIEVADRTNKRMKPSVEGNETTDSGIEVAKDADEENASIPVLMASEQMEAEIANIFQKMEHFTNLVSELLESGKSMLKDLSNEFEERLIQIHKEQMEKWQEEIKEVRLLDTANEEADSLLLNAKTLLQNVHGES
ncbi:uncharacterized protein LOC132599660 [Lycium barbarum]|uniref:uncharacterized protein LOC132052309 n=1 Tax=Lycium ferocissimum TaxID=112874 RepID=UPI00281541D6|nr:uncharacterized protein LOC132052309 [Lycium ferocissimum]XP_060168935.1 uncharacterized protein LOC132599660 [Lycium barbarum]XP_060168940.1 uncharacterized protein LOC132599660 [Lycium barbarum]